MEANRASDDPESLFDDEGAPTPRMGARLGVAPPGEGLHAIPDRERIAMVSEPRGAIAEQFRSLRNAVIALNPEGASRTVVLASAVSGEGKTVAAINLAAALAELPGIEVLIVDANLHTPKLEDYLGLPRRQGLADVLRGECPLDEAVRQTAIERVSIVGAGNLPENPSRILGSERMRAVLNLLKQRSSYVLVDTPEALTISDASQIGAIADGVLLVVRLDSTPRQLVEQAHQQLESLGGNVLGTCLIGAPPPRPRKGDRADRAAKAGGVGKAEQA